MTLLILDRVSASRRRLNDLFANRFDTVAVGSIFGAFRVLRHRAFDAILVKSGGMDGFAIAVLKWLQIHQLAIGTIALLARGARDEGELLHRLGARSTLPWPANERQVMRAVAAVGSCRYTPGHKAAALAIAGANGIGSRSVPAEPLRPDGAERRVLAVRRHRNLPTILRACASTGAQLAGRN